jgi:hypothetical protein
VQQASVIASYRGRLLSAHTAQDAIDLTPGGYVVEIKGYLSEVQYRSQVQAEAQIALQSGRPLWVIVRQGGTVARGVINAAEGTGGGVLIRTGPHQYTNLNNEPVKVGPGMKVTDYKPVTGDDSPGTSDPEAPSAPVNPSDTTGQAPADPIDPDPGVGDPDPFIP